MEKTQVFEKVREIVVDQFGVDEAEVKMDASFVDDFGSDSLGLVELIIEMEDEFGIDISDEDAANIKTVEDAVDYIAGNL